MATKEEIIESLKQVIDPELFIDVYTLGLIYDVELNDGDAHIKMTFTSMACPAGPQLADEVKMKTLEVDGVENAKVEIVFDPPWAPSEELKAMLGLA